MSTENSFSASENQYEIKLDLGVLNHLGINLYSNVAAVLSEAVANAWDAYASNVQILIESKDSIEIKDDGHGMTVSDANSRYLKVGYNRRDMEPIVTGGNRRMMGRKGIGKLSLFSIANCITVHSTKGGESHAFRIIVDKLKAAMKDNGRYSPEPVDVKGLKPLDKGTRISLTQLNRRATAQSIAALRKRIARRFTILGTNDFRVWIGSDEVTAQDRDDFKVAQFVWEFNSKRTINEANCPKLKRHALLQFSVDIDGGSYPVSGWIASAAKPRELDSADAGNLNSIVVLARGRLIQENVLDRINEGGLYTKYLTGQVEADFLDLDAQDDIATSDRQRVIEDDPRYVALEQFIRKALGCIESQWTEWRNELGGEEAEEIFPELTKWLDSLKPAQQKHARKVIAKLQSLTIEDKEEKRLLLKHGVLAFERLRLREASDSLADALDVGIGEVIKLLADMDTYEGSLYLDIVRNRVAEIETLKRITDEDEKEKVIQEFLSEHLWLLDPSWERIEGTVHVESKVKDEFVKIDAELTDEEKLGRRDIKYRAVAKRHVIVELKRTSVKSDVQTLVKQVRKYERALRKVLDACGCKDEGIEVVLVLGAYPTDNDPDFIDGQLKTVHARVLTYDELIDRAYQNYSAFMQSKQKKDALEALLTPQKNAPVMGVMAAEARSDGASDSVKS